MKEEFRQIFQWFQSPVIIAKEKASFLRLLRWPNKD
jgi:hypothetical protein